MLTKTYIIMLASYAILKVTAKVWSIKGGICIKMMKSRNEGQEFLSLIPAFMFICLTEQ